MSKAYRDPRTLVPWGDLIIPDVINVKHLTAEELAPVLRTRMVWDIVPDEKIPEWFDVLGLTGTSPDTTPCEQAGAEARRVRLAPFGTILSLAASIAGDVIYRARMKGREDKSVPDPGTIKVVDEEQAQLDTMTAVAAGALAIIAELIDLNVLAYGKALRS